MMRAFRIMIAPVPEACLQSYVGLGLWALAVLWWRPAWSPALLTFGPLIIYPALFDLLGSDWATLRRLSLLAFLPALVSYGFEQGAVAGALALPWLLFAFGMFLYRLVPELRAKNYARIVIQCYLTVGAGWLVLARLGQRPLGFSDAIVHATAVHFHYAGFVVPILALQWINAGKSPRRYVLLCSLLLGVPLVAAGITLSTLGIPWLELAAVWFFVAACVWFAFEQALAAYGAHPRWCRALMLISSLSLVLAMSLAILYATANYWKLEWLDIPFMLRSHAPIQVFGFALPGTIAWARKAAKGSD